MWRFLKWVMLGAGALLTIFAVYMLVGPDNHKVALLKRLETAEGVVAQAKVINKYTEEYKSYENSGSRPGGRSLGRAVRLVNEHNHRDERATVNYLYFVEAEFKTAQGQTVRANLNYPEKFDKSIKSGAVVSVLYHPAEPAAISRLLDYSSPYHDMRDLHVMMAVFALGAAGVLFWFGWPRRDAEEGVDADAVDADAVVEKYIASTRSPRAATSDAPVRRVASGRASGAPQGFGRRARTARG